MRRGEPLNTSQYVTAWSKLPVGIDRKAPLSELYSPATINEIVAGLETADRWGVSEVQITLASKIINSQIINRIVREYIDDQIDVKTAISKLNKELLSIK